MNTSGKCFRQRRVDYRLDYSNEVTKATSKEDCQTQCINAQNFQCTGFAYRCVIVITFSVFSPNIQLPIQHKYIQKNSVCTGTSLPDPKIVLINYPNAIIFKIVLPEIIRNSKSIPAGTRNFYKITKKKK